MNSCFQNSKTNSWKISIILTQNRLNCRIVVRSSLLYFRLYVYVQELRIFFLPYSCAWVCCRTRVGTISQSSSETSFKLLRFTSGLSHLEKLPFVVSSIHITSANAKKSKWQIFGTSDHSSKNQHFRNPTNYTPLDPEFYTDHYLQRDYTLKRNCNKDKIVLQQVFEVHHIYYYCL